jgi:hydroxyquinol 1,2-dioxygenase
MMPPGAEICIYGQILDTAGNGIPNAAVEIWQTDEHGAYDLQKQDPSLMDCRAQFQTDAQGRYHLRTVAPAATRFQWTAPSAS